jgi:predicted GNAT superfamily acetyltransferase
MGIELIEWTYDPLQALNAHLNFRKLGIVVGEYEENIYGESSSPLHRGNPTDRFVAEWWVRSPHVERRLSGSRPGGHAAEIEQAASVNKTRRADGWLECESSDLSLANARLGVEIPIGFSEMLIRRPDLALAWRIETRKIFTHYFARGYRAVEFFLDREKGRGTYLLTSEK